MITPCSTTYTAIMPNDKLHLIEHPLLTDALARMRARQTATAAFRQAVHEATLILTVAVTKTFPTTSTTITTPLGECATARLTHPHPIIVPILRAALGMLPAIQTLLPTAHVGFVGVQRDEHTHQPHPYYCKLPPVIDDDCPVIICDPMLATGGTISHTIHLVEQAGLSDIHVMTLLSAPEGIAEVHRQYPDIPIYTASVDQKLTDQAFIYPGAGDVGDRLFGTPA
jgi:uracil phosphoribosyltransferase